ncbi:MAG: hypothetical protein ACTSRC_14765 [Candidatus Helarchaeota archaeon]
MRYKKVYFTDTTKGQIIRHSELSKEEIEEWLNNPVFERQKMTDGYCLTNVIYRPDSTGTRKKRKVFVYYREYRKKFVALRVHLGRIGDKCIDRKKKPKVKVKGPPKKRRRYKKRRRKYKKKR